jgi:hypothetical protein
MNHFKFLACCVFLLPALVSGAQQNEYLDSATRQNVAQIVDFIMKDDATLEYDRALADDIGPRLTGSQAYADAARWATEQFRALKLDNVHTERFRMKAAWEPRIEAKAELLRPRQQTLHMISLGWSPSTPTSGVRGRVFLIRNLLSPQALEQDRNKIKGSIALVDRSSYSFTNGLLPGTYFAALASLRDYGAQAVLIGGGRSDNDVDYGGAVTMDGSIASLPIARVGREDLALMMRLLTKGPVTAQFSYQNQIRTPAQAENVIAEIRGREKPDEFVIVGAHLDSVQVGTGAQDNAAGVATVLETARAIMASGVVPRRSIRFILFGGEEEWELGSKAYVGQHEPELGKCSAVLITDTGSDTSYGWYVNGRDDEVPALKDIGPLLQPLGGSGISQTADYLLHSDHTAFLLRGVPTLMLWTEMSNYFHYVHQPGDTFDKIDRQKFAKGTAIFAVTAYAIADSARPFAPHLSRNEVDQLLKTTKQYEGYLDMVKHSAGQVVP